MVLTEKKVRSLLNEAEENVRLIRQACQFPTSMPYGGFASDLYLSTSYIVDILWRSLLVQSVDVSHRERIKRLMKFFSDKLGNELLDASYRSSQAYEMYYSQKNVPALELF